MTYNAVLKEDLQEGCNLLGFADETVADLERRANWALKQIEDKISDLGLQIAGYYYMLIIIMIIIINVT